MSYLWLVIGAHLLAAAAALATTLTILLLPARLRSLLRHLGWASAGTVVWALSVASVRYEGLHPWHQIAWLPSVAFTAGALLLWARWFARQGWPPATTLVGLWLSVPLLILGVRVVGGVDVRLALSIVNTVYCLVLVLAISVHVAGRAGDPEPGPRRLARFVLAAAVATLIAEAFRLNVTDIFVAATLAVVVATTWWAGEDVAPRPDPEALIDDLGALLLVFDAQQRLVDANAPTRLFYSMRGAAPPAQGTAAVDLLGTDLVDLDALTVLLEVGGERLRLSGYAQRLPSDGTPPGGWVCLLRRSASGGLGDSVQQARRASMGQVPAHDPATGLLSARALLQALGQASGERGERAEAVVVVVGVPDDPQLSAVATALTSAWESRPEAVTAGRWGRSSIGLLVRGTSEPSARAWCAQATLGHDVRIATRSGAVSEAAALMAAAETDLDGASGPPSGTGEKAGRGSGRRRP